MVEPSEETRIRVAATCPDLDRMHRVAAAGEVQDGPDGRVQVLHNGLLVAADAYRGPWMTQLMSGTGGHYDAQQEVAMAATLERLSDTPKARMLDLGCGWGVNLMWFVRDFIDGSAAGIDEDPAMVSLARRHLGLNHLHAHIEQGDTTDLATALGGRDWERVDLVVANLAGGEAAFVDEAQTLLSAGAVRFLVLATNHRIVTGDPLTHQRLRDQLQHLGGTVIAEHSVSESYSGTGLIAVGFEQRDQDFRVRVTTARSRDSVHGESELQLADAITDLTGQLDETNDMLAATEAEVAEYRKSLAGKLFSRRNR